MSNLVALLRRAVAARVSRRPAARQALRGAATLRETDLIGYVRSYCNLLPNKILIIYLLS